MQSRDDEGAVLILSMILLSVSIIFITAMNTIIYNNTNRFERDKKSEKAKQLARAGLEEKLNELEAGAINLGTSSNDLGAGSYQTTVEINSEEQLIISSHGVVDNQEKKLAAKTEVPTIMIDYNNFAQFNNWDNMKDGQTTDLNLHGNGNNNSWEFFDWTADNNVQENKHWNYRNNGDYLYTKNNVPKQFIGLYNNDDLSLEDYELEIEIKNDTNEFGVMGFSFRYKDENNHYYVHVKRFDGVIIDNYELALYKVSDGIRSRLDVEYDIIYGIGDDFSLFNWRKLKIQVVGNNIKVYFDDQLELAAEDNSPITNGSYGPVADSLSDARFRNLKIKFLNIEEAEIINDKDDDKPKNSINNSVVEIINEQTYYKDIKVEYDPNKIYRLTARIKQKEAANSGGQNCSIGIQGFDGSADVIDDYYVAANDISLAVSDRWQTFVGYFTGPDNAPTDLNPTEIDAQVKTFRPIVKVNHDNGDGTVRIDYLKIEQLEINKD